MTERRIRPRPWSSTEAVLTGIVSIGDVVKARIGELEFERDQLESYVSGPGWAVADSPAVVLPMAV